MSPSRGIPMEKKRWIARIGKPSTLALLGDVVVKALNILCSYVRSTPSAILRTCASASSSGNESTRGTLPPTTTLTACPRHK